MHRHMTIVLLAVMLTASDAAAEKFLQQHQLRGDPKYDPYQFR